MLTLTPRLISHISQDINNNRPIWAILRIMEYREANPTISRILLSKAISKVRELHFQDRYITDLNLDNLEERLSYLSQITEKNSNRTGHFGSRPLLVKPKLRQYPTHQSNVSYA